VTPEPAPQLKETSVNPLESLGLQYAVMQTGMNAAVVDRAAL
jgi:hypothetical protein